MGEVSGSRVVGEAYAAKGAEQYDKPIGRQDAAEAFADVRAEVGRLEITEAHQKTAQAEKSRYGLATAGNPVEGKGLREYAEVGAEYHECQIVAQYVEAVVLTGERQAVG